MFLRLHPGECPPVSGCPWTSSNYFRMSLANSFVEYDRPGPSCDKSAAPITTLRYCLVCNASNRGDVTNTDSSLFLTDGWSRQSLRTFQIQRLDNQLRVSNVSIILNPTPVTIGVPTHVSIEDSHLLGVIATCTKDCPNLSRVMTAHHFTQRFIVKDIKSSP